MGRHARAILVRAVWAGLVVTPLAGCGGGSDDAGANGAALAAGGGGGADGTSSYRATVVFDGESLPTAGVLCSRDRAELGMPGSITVELDYPDADRGRHEFAVRNYGGVASLVRPTEFDVPTGVDRWQAAAEYDPTREYGEGEVLRLAGVEYSFQGTTGVVEVAYDDFGIENFDRPAPRLVEFEIECP